MNGVKMFLNSLLKNVIYSLSENVVRFVILDVLLDVKKKLLSCKMRNHAVL